MSGAEVGLGFPVSLINSFRVESHVTGLPRHHLSLQLGSKTAVKQKTERCSYWISEVSTQDESYSVIACYLFHFSVLGHMV